MRAADLPDRIDVIMVEPARGNGIPVLQLAFLDMRDVRIAAEHVVDFRPFPDVVVEVIQDRGQEVGDCFPESGELFALLTIHTDEIQPPAHLVAGDGCSGLGTRCHVLNGRYPPGSHALKCIG